MSALAPPLRLLFAGTPDFAASALAALLESRHAVAAVYTQPDRPAGRGRRPRPSPVKQLAERHGLPVEQPETLREPAAQERLRAWEADAMVVAAYGLILPPAVLAIPRLGCINIHASLLPRWRGAAPIQRAILAGDTRTGVSIMQMDAGLDTGPVLREVPVDIGPQETGGSLHDRLAAAGAGAIVQSLDELAAGTAVAIPQEAARATYAAKLARSEAQLDWRRPAAELERQVRAFDPWPVAHTHVGEHTLRVWRAQVVDADRGEPGTVLAVGRDGIEVACGSGALRLTRVQLAGGRPQEVASLINGHPDLVAAGMRLDDTGDA